MDPCNSQLHWGNGFSYKNKVAILRARGGLFLDGQCAGDKLLMALLPLDFVNIPLLSFDIHCFFASFLKKERTKTSRRISLIVIICYSSLYYQITFFFLPSLKNNLVVLQYVCMCVCSVTSVVSDYLRPYRL